MSDTTWRILVTGSRDWADGEAIEREMLCRWLEWDCPPRDRVTLVHGGARGADAVAAAIARRVGMNVECHPAAWDTRGRAAGHIRNSEMVNTGADVCLAFIRFQSRGATGCAALAERAGIRTITTTSGCWICAPEHPGSLEEGCDACDRASDEANGIKSAS